MTMSVRRSLPVSVALLALALVAGCGGGEPDEGVEESPPPATAAADEAAVEVTEADVEPAASEPAEADPGTDPETEGETGPATDAETGPETDGEGPPADPGTDEDSNVDLDTAPGPDPQASAEDYPDFEWAFEEGRYAGSYGRADYYEPSTVSEPGSMAGVAAAEAYRGGFALGLAEYEAAVAAGQEASASAEAEAEAAAQYPIGELIEGWDPAVAVSEFWGIEGAESCAVAAATDPCLDVWYSEGNSVITALGRLDPAASAEPDHALRLSGTARGYEVQEAWDATVDPTSSAPDWTQRPG